MRSCLARSGKNVVAFGAGVVVHEKMAAVPNLKIARRRTTTTRVRRMRRLVK